VRPSAAETNAPAGLEDSPAALTDILLSSLEALAATGQVDPACRLAGQACAALRKNDLSGWRKFNALLHRLSILVA
jgi:hypothetical protein